MFILCNLGIWINRENLTPAFSFWSWKSLRAFNAGRNARYTFVHEPNAACYGNLSIVCIERGGFLCLLWATVVEHRSIVVFKLSREKKRFFFFFLSSLPVQHFFSVRSVNSVVHIRVVLYTKHCERILFCAFFRPRNFGVLNPGRRTWTFCPLVPIVMEVSRSIFSSYQNAVILSHAVHFVSSLTTYWYRLHLPLNIPPPPG